MIHIFLISFLLRYYYLRVPVVYKNIPLYIFINKRDTYCVCEFDVVLDKFFVLSTKIDRYPIMRQRLMTAL